MFGFFLGCITIIAGYKLSQHFDSNNPEKREKENDDKLLAFAKRDESQKVFKETLELLNELIQRANSEDNFGNLYHTETFERNVYQFQIMVKISPTTLSWTVKDLSQSERLKSHTAYSVVYDRSRKLIIEDEMRLNEGSTYSWGSILKIDNDHPFLPFAIDEKFDALNQAGWNIVPKKGSTSANQPFKNEMNSTSTVIRNLLQDNRESMDASVVTLIEDILTLSNKILDEEKEHASDNVEFKHDLNRLLEDEILSILEIYIDLDEIRKEEVKEMTQNALNKAYNHLKSQYDAFQQEKVSRLKQTQLVMEERYE